MRIQIVHDDGTVLYVPALNQHLESDVREMLSKYPWWRPIKRAHRKHAIREIESVTAALRDATRY